MKLIRMAVGTAAVVAALAVPVVTASAGTTATQDFDRGAFGTNVSNAIDQAMIKAHAAASSAGYTEAQCVLYAPTEWYYLGDHFPQFQAIVHLRCTN